MHVFVRISLHANVRALVGRRNVLEVSLGHVDLFSDGIGKGEVQKEQRLVSQLEEYVCNTSIGSYRPAVTRRRRLRGILFLGM